jgi:hypothetical protein
MCSVLLMGATGFDSATDAKDAARQAIDVNEAKLQTQTTAFFPSRLKNPQGTGLTTL